MSQMRRVGAVGVLASLALTAAAAYGGPVSAATVVTVAQDGSGNFTTVQAAVNAAPSNGSGYEIDVKPGTYRGTVSIPSAKTHVTLKGTGSTRDQVVIVENHAASTYGTQGSATVAVSANDFRAENLTFANDYDEAKNGSSQAVALDLNADRAVLNNVRVLGNQDTLLLWTAGTGTVGRSYIRKSYVEGDVDFIFGRGTAVFDRSEIHSLSRGSSTNNGYVTAAATTDTNPYGFLFYRSTLTSNAPAKSVYLGRPWHPSGDVHAVGQVLFRECTLGAHIRDDPWTDMSGFSWKSARFSEYGDTGAGAAVNANRPQLTASQAPSYTPNAYLAGSDGWNPVF
ncbi:pectinesterase family protein [Actinoallomurus rhizosphaericola]|uniref:pectinesterase family protein n=1 Tax=Actinoallomurus rhizosphaericola TaxID=2952536 RepID=UPI00209112C6|nr:pectinesterase family protein [Actinoallomurus rhizosphaericola]MCO5992927.1 pectinesterase family protein [Actinoallomurus rhizosphaericola]